MNLSLNVIYDNLEIPKKRLPYTEANSDMIYYGVMLYKQNIIYDQHLQQYLLLAPASEFPAHLSGHALLSIGTPSPALIRQNICIILPKEAEIFQVFYQVQEIFHQFAKWERHLYQYVSHPNFLQVACEAMADYTHAPTVFHNDQQILQAWSSLDELHTIWNYNPSIQQYALSSEVLNQFKTSKAYENTMSAKQTSFFEDDVQGNSSLYCNFFVNKQFLGRYCVVFFNRVPRPGDYQILDYICQLTQRAFSYGRISLVNHTNVVENCISQAIDGTLKNYDELIHYLHQFSWKANDAYICAIMPLEERDATTYTAVNSCLNLKQLFPNSFVFTKDNNIVLLLNLSLSQIDASEVPRLLADFLREGLFKAGISNVKAELPSLKEAYKEANMILEMGDDIAPTKWCYQFSEHRIEYGYWEATKILHPESLIHESIQQLLQHDEQHSGQLTETLETYLKHDRNLTQTSNLLFIHRSTLQYRLEKIENMTHLDLNDPDTRYQLLYSFDLLKWYESTF